MDTKNSKTISIRVGLSFAFSFVVVLAALGMGVSSYFVAVRHFRSELGGKIRGLVATVSQLIDSEKHAKINGVEDETSPEYAELKIFLQQIRKANPEIHFIYTMRRINEKVIFAVDAETDPKLVSHPGDVYEDASASIHNFFKSRKVIFVENEFTSDKWGTFLSGYAPIFNKAGQFEAAVGIDVDASYVLAAENSIRNLIMWWTLGILLSTVLISIVLAKRISRSLSILADEVRKVQNLDLSSQVEVGSMVTEIYQVVDALDAMKKALRSFKKFVPADLVIDMMKLKKEAILETEKRELTILFSDIADFTSISEKLSSQDLSSNMAEYLGQVSNTIKEQSGTIDKFIGDAVMAVWNAPRPCDNHAYYACLAAIECQKKIKKLNLELEAKGFPAFRTRIGINTGEAIVGNMGTHDRMSFTAIGDSVNLSSRIEGLNKYYGSDILVSESTWNLVSDQFAARVIDKAVVKGKSVANNLYSVVDLKAKLTESEQKLVLDHNAAMDLYFGGYFEKARLQFRALGLAYPNDMIIKSCLNRIDEKIREYGDSGNYFATQIRHK